MYRPQLTMHNPVLQRNRFVVVFAIHYITCYFVLRRLAALVVDDTRLVPMYERHMDTDADYKTPPSYQFTFSLRLEIARAEATPSPAPTLNDLFGSPP